MCPITRHHDSMLRRRFITLIIFPVGFLLSSFSLPTLSLSLSDIAIYTVYRYLNVQVYAEE
jgi:hypothetical protein